jgi:ferric-dicitrate binding protein FerR (iron transport regulator)
MTPDRKDQTDIERLLTLAGPRDAVPADRLERMRAVVHDAWRAETRPVAKGLHTWTLMTIAAAAVVVLAVMRILPDATIVEPAQAPAAAATRITTGSAARQSRLLTGGGELRVDTSSVVTIATGGEVQIVQGAIYLDSKGATLPPVITPAGRITDIGTRFEVRIVDGNTRVRVRDGKVQLAQARIVSEIAAAEELLAHADASTRRRRIDPFGADWAWVARAAPRFELEGKSLRSFLDWIAHEGAWTVAFASPELERTARLTVLHGSIENMSTTEALDAILPACGLTHRIDLATGRVTVMAESR